MTSATPRRRSPCLVLCLLVACADRDPLDSASASVGETGGGSGGETTSTTTTANTTTAADATTGDVTSGTTALDTGEPTTGGPSGSGLYLFALSTIISPDQPLQFLADTAWSEGTMRLVLQPLALDLGKVTTPRVPVGEPLVFDPIAVVDGQFEADLGTVQLVGAANPITGGDIAAALTLRGVVEGDAFYCGEVEGELVSPLMAPLDGSTFAAVRVASAEALPPAVTVDCAGDTVTDP